MRKVLNLSQGSEEWKQARLKHFCASEAPAVMGVSKYMTRTELLDLKKSGISKPISSNQQIVFDLGHKAEAEARIILEITTLVEYPPVVFQNNEYGIPLLASLDGYNKEGNIVWEHKLWNKTLSANVLNDVLEDHYMWQLEHQLLVTGADHAIFTCSDGTDVKKENMFYYSQPEKRKLLIEAWKAFGKDLESHEIKAKEEKIKPIASDSVLPAIVFNVIGSDISSNIALCLEETKSLALSEKSKELHSDLDFANKDQFNKDVKKARILVKNTIESVKDEFVSFAEFSTLANELDSVLQKMQSSGEKQVKEAKEKKKQEAINIGQKAIVDFVAEKNEIIAPQNLYNIISGIAPDFITAIKGKRTIDSIAEAITQLVVDTKIALQEVVDKITINMLYLKLDDEAKAHDFLFKDVSLLLNKGAEDFTAVIKSRISDYKTAQTKIEADKKAKEEADKHRRIHTHFDQASKGITPETTLSKNVGGVPTTDINLNPKQSDLFEEKEAPTIQSEVSNWCDENNLSLNASEQLWKIIEKYI